MAKNFDNRILPPAPLPNSGLPPGRNGWPILVKLVINQADFLFQVDVLDVSHWFGLVWFGMKWLVELIE